MRTLAIIGLILCLHIFDIHAVGNTNGGPILLPPYRYDIWNMGLIPPGTRHMWSELIDGKYVDFMDDEIPADGHIGEPFDRNDAESLFDAENTFKRGELVVVRDKNGTLIFGQVVCKEDAEYQVCIEFPGPKDRDIKPSFLPEAIGKIEEIE